MAAPTISATTTELTVYVGQPISIGFGASPAPDEWTARNLPPGLTIAAATGVISGTPTATDISAYATYLAATIFADRVCTAAATDVVTAVGNSFADDDEVYFETTGTLPAGLAVDTLYFVRDHSADTFKVSLEVNGAAVDITDTGTGVHTVRERETSAEQLVVMTVSSALGITESDGFGTLFRFDILSKEVSFPGYDAKTDEATGLLIAPKMTSGDRHGWITEAVRYGVAQDLSVATHVVTLKEFDPETAIELTNGSVVQLGTGTSSRYQTEIYLDPDVFNPILSNYEADEGTSKLFLAEVEMSLLGAAESFSASPTAETFTLTGNDSEDSAGFDITGLAEVATANYLLTATLTVNGHSAQDLVLTRELVITWDGATFAASSADASSIQADAESEHWRATLANDSLVGDADSVTIGTLVTTDDYGYWECQIPFDTFVVTGSALDDGAAGAGADDVFHLRDTDSNIIGSAITLDHGDTAADILAAIEVETGVNDVISVTLDDGADTAIVRFSDDTVVREMYDPVNLFANAATETPNGPSYASSSVAITLVGQSSAANRERKTCAPFLIPIVRELSAG